MLAYVTFTGWDRHTDLDELGAFLEDCPQSTVEIAVLFSTSRSQDDEDRYPNVDKAKAILKVAKAAGQRTAVHLCGRIARAFLGYSDAIVKVGPLIQLAERVQVNVPEDFWASSPERYKPAHDLARLIGRSVIVQSRSIDGWPDVEHLGPGASRMVPFLFDRSAGTGAAPPDWPFPRAHILVGYAGGLGPDNVAGLCESIAGARIDGARWWLDMETGIRERFSIAKRRPDEPPLATYVSLAKCQRVMSAVGPWLEGR